MKARQDGSLQRKIERGASTCIAENIPLLRLLPQRGGKAKGFTCICTTANLKHITGDELTIKTLKFHCFFGGDERRASGFTAAYGSEDARQSSPAWTSRVVRNATGHGVDPASRQYVDPTNNPSRETNEMGGHNCWRRGGADRNSEGCLVNDSAIPPGKSGSIPSCLPTRSAADAKK